MIPGESIYLRALEVSDQDRYHRWFNDPEVTVTLVRHEPITLLAEREWLEQGRGRRSPSDLSLAICLKADDRHIGSVGFHRIHAVNRTASLGVVIGERDLWGRGYGSDAVRTLCRYGFDSMNLGKIRLDVYDFNPRAAGVYERLGFKREGLFRKEVYRNGEYRDVIRMGLLPEDLP